MYACIIMKEEKACFFSDEWEGDGGLLLPISCSCVRTEQMPLAVRIAVVILTDHLR